MRFHMAALGVAAAFLAQMAQAQDPVAMTLEQLKEKCRLLQHEVEHGQMQPFTINLECSRERTFWAAQASRIPLPGYVFHTGSADVKGRYIVSPLTRKTGEHNSPSDCATLFEWKVQSFKIPVVLQTCVELETVRDLSFYCARRLPGDIDEAAPVKTGRHIDMCSAPIINPAQPPQ